MCKGGGVRWVGRDGGSCSAMMPSNVHHAYQWVFLKISYIRRTTIVSGRVGCWWIYLTQLGRKIQLTII